MTFLLRLTVALSLFTTFSAIVYLPAGAQALTTLYGARPPAGSSYVRVVNPSAVSASVKIGSASATSISSRNQIATTYTIVAGGRPLAVTIDGKNAKNTISPVADGFVTVVMRKDADGVALIPIVDDAGDVDGLRAQLRFYNLVPGCTGSLSVEGGPTIFDAVAVNETKARVINPISATVRPRCAPANGPVRKLPPLKAGDRYSIFLIGNAAHPATAGNADATEPYQSK